MTGTLPNLALAQRVDQNGLPASGARLFIFEANTSTAAIAYKDYALTEGMAHPQPIVADALGLIPMFWLPDGFYRARLEDRYGTPLIDEPVLPAVGTGGGGEAPGAPAALEWVTGDFLWQPVQGERTLWVRANGRTIGNALSGAVERANPDTEALFSFLWNNFPDSICTVYPSRGASAVADYNAPHNKAIRTFDMRGFMAIGLDGMGNTLAGRFPGVPVTVGGIDAPGSYVGVNAQAMSVEQMPSHGHSATTTVSVSLGDPGHTHGYYDTYPIAGGAGGVGGGGATVTPQGDTTEPAPTGVYILSASGATTVNASGGNVAQNNVPYAVPGTWYIRL